MAVNVSSSACGLGIFFAAALALGSMLLSFVFTG
jgi:hypothetical protein